MSKHTVKVHRWSGKRLFTNHHEFYDRNQVDNFVHHQVQFGTRDICIKIYNEAGELLAAIGECANCPDESYA